MSDDPQENGAEQQRRRRVPGGEITFAFEIELVTNHAEMPAGEVLDIARGEFNQRRREVGDRKDRHHNRESGDNGFPGKRQRHRSAPLYYARRIDLSAVRTFASAASISPATYKGGLP